MFIFRQSSPPPQKISRKYSFVLAGNVLGKTLIGGLVTLCLAQCAWAGEADIKAEIEAKFPYAKVVGIHKTPYSGLYEVVFSDHLAYVDASGRYFFSGNVFDLRTMQNLTAAHEQKLHPSGFDTLPFDLAIKQVKGDGRRKLAVFTDPNCPYCKKLDREMIQLNNITIYTFVMTILPGSESEARTLWCAPDRQKAWEEHMLKGVEPSRQKSCDVSALTRVAALAKTLGISVTPTLYFSDGTIKPGILPPDQLDEKLNETEAK